MLIVTVTSINAYIPNRRCERLGTITSPMPMPLVSKTLYMLWRACPKNAWLRLHKPEVYFAEPLSEFDQAIIDTGVEAELIGWSLFRDGSLILGEPPDARRRTSELLGRHTPTPFQASFVWSQLVAA